MSTVVRLALVSAATALAVLGLGVAAAAEALTVETAALAALVCFAVGALIGSRYILKVLIQQPTSQHPSDPDDGPARDSWGPGLIGKR